MTARVGNTALTVATVALLLAAAAPWLLPIERWLPEPLPATQGQARALGAPLNPADRTAIAPDICCGG